MTSARSSGGQGPLYRLYIARLRRQIDPASVPGHVAMMIDGNRRWKTGRRGAVIAVQRAEEFVQCPRCVRFLYSREAIAKLNG